LAIGICRFCTTRIGPARMRTSISMFEIWREKTSRHGLMHVAWPDAASPGRQAACIKRHWAIRRHRKTAAQMAQMVNRPYVMRMNLRTGRCGGKTNNTDSFTPVMQTTKMICCRELASVESGAFLSHSYPQKPAHLGKAHGIHVRPA
jgi:hypothetical protein